MGVAASRRLAAQLAAPIGQLGPSSVRVVEVVGQLLAIPTKALHSKWFNIEYTLLPQTLQEWRSSFTLSGLFEGPDWVRWQMEQWQIADQSGLPSTSKCTSPQWHWPLCVAKPRQKSEGAAARVSAGRCAAMRWATARGTANMLERSATDTEACWLHERVDDLS
eukprot:CAMPEP_0183387150 /NCGR_PEP_ID=MMETSP0370-20130417/2937_1 /TAXON_ID=268820 /ORGANISM="Peridinium aciculiferum, Strain PAER-2" /LENGTH=163 /DNA_ID=CAMNT_0025565643 /DNA_START=81 /DNA_END=571 /DNA_ORIENTATION=+